ncbi:hypothetical protein AVDCRST_MAG94-7037 [uncultured Leptolyngbya sp.]|uniref:Uncharacterized protein n=1 Tax=uncultured Leptolyngbya sp. TaxID=332963 RepID=A0A6J4PTD4_9CYAN|nr:hypothetical protein AVDCRST_MAG94-7037 [uncultured Leptolyngbya sp.]
MKDDLNVLMITYTLRRSRQHNSSSFSSLSLHPLSFRTFQGNLA